MIRFAKKIYSLLRKIFVRLFLSKVGGHGKNVYVGKRVIVRNPQYLFIGDNVGIDDDVEFCCTKSLDSDPQCVLNDNVWIGRMTRFGCDYKIILEKGVVVGPHCHISDRNHCYDDICLPVSEQPMVTKGAVVIGEDSWLGFGCQIMSGVKIGKHCVVAAGSIVVKDVPDYCVVGGNPAKILKQYSFVEKKWMSAK